MDSNLLAQLPVAAALYGSAAFAAQVGTNLFTLAAPDRSPRTAILAALVIGMLATALLAAATIADLSSRQTIAQVIIVGLLAGGSAAGANELQKKADEKRADAETMSNLRRPRP